MHEIELHDDADAEMKAAAQWYERQRDNLGEEFLDEVEAGLTRIVQFPELWPVLDGEYRRHLIKRFPYGLVYRVENELIYVIAVMHLKRRPGYWKNRT